MTTINLDNVAQWWKRYCQKRAEARQARQEAQRQAEKAAREEARRKRIADHAIDNLLVIGDFGPGGLIVITKPEGRIHHYQALCEESPRTRKEFVNYCSWYIVDTDRSFDNTIKMSNDLVEEFIDAVGLEYFSRNKEQ